MRIISFIFLICMAAFSFGQKSKILSKHKTLTYLTTYSDSTNKVFIIDTLKFISTKIPWRAQPDKQTTVVWKYSKLNLHDSIKKKLFSIGWIEVDSTGGVDIKDRFWIHPPRNNHYTMTEIAPFPTVRRPLKIDFTFGQKLSIGWGWGPWSDLELSNNYKVVAKETKTMNDVAYECWKTKSFNESKLGRTTLTTLFIEEIGFIQFDYHFYNKTSLLIDLIKVD